MTRVTVTATDGPRNAFIQAGLRAPLLPLAAAARCPR